MPARRDPAGGDPMPASSGLGAPPTRESRQGSPESNTDAFFERARSADDVDALKRERFTNDHDADAFFHGRWPTGRLSALLDEAGTPQMLLDAWARDCERARAAHTAQAASITASVREAEAPERERLEREHAAARARRRQTRAQREKRRRQKAAEASQRWRDRHPDRAAHARARWEADNKERRRQASHDYYLRNKAKVKAGQRARHDADPTLRKEYHRRYAIEHPDRVAASNAAWRAKPGNRERHVQATQDWSRRERQRRDAGLPPRRIHASTISEIRAARAEADAFFQVPWPPQLVRRLRHPAYGGPTPADLLDAWKADCDSARLRYRLAEDPRFRRRYEILQARGQTTDKTTDEDRRMDAIARAINVRLRTQPRRRPDLAAPLRVAGVEHHGGIER